MRLTTEFRETPAGLFSRAKHWHLCCRVAFSHEERAIIEERGLQHLGIVLPPAERPSNRLAYVGIGFIRPGSKLLLLIAAIMIAIGFAPAYNTLQTIGTWLLFIAIGLWLFSWWKEHEAEQRLNATQQRVAVGTLLARPDFSVYAYTQLQAQEDEARVREQLSLLSAQIKASAEVPAQASYEL